MFDSPLEFFGACCTICSVYTVLLEQAKRLQANDAGKANLSLAALQSAWHIGYGTCLSTWTWTNCKLAASTAVLYLLNIWMPVLGQVAGIDSLTLLLLRASSPIFTSWIQPKPTTRRQQGALVIAALGILCASIGALENKGSWTGLGILCCFLGTAAACALGVEQSRVMKTSGISLGSLLAHMHLLSGVPFVFVLPTIVHWTWAMPTWLIVSCTLSQWLCSNSIAWINKRCDPVTCQLTLAIRRALCTLLVAAIYAEQTTTWHVASLVLVSISSFVYIHG